ncbi:hypothetical protein M5689_002579 [Euphorbia peplus]|nr:hypothetical protein M5689_002579 [Euphorbia peplus]
MIHTKTVFFQANSFHPSTRVSLRGLMREDTGITVRCEILKVSSNSLDLATDTFTSSMVPTRFLSSLDNVRAFKAGGLLAIGTIDVKKKNLHILMLQDHKESKWAESLIVYPLNCLSSRDVKRATPFFIRKGRLWLWIAGKKFVGYNTMTKTVFRTDVAPKGRSIANRVQFNSSTLVLLRGMREDIDTSL